MRALANKFGAHLTFSHGESTGIIDLAQQNQPEAAPSAMATTLEAARAITNFNRAYWGMLLRMYGWGRRPDRKANRQQKNAIRRSAIAKGLL